MTAPKLSKGFFQGLIENSLPSGTMPILQIIEARPIKQQPNSCYRVRMSDGLHSYSGCGMSHALNDRFRADGLDEQNGIIRVTSFVRNANGSKITLTISDYELISTDFPVIGNPTAHTGRPEDCKGIDKFKMPDSENSGSRAVKRENDGSSDYNRQPLTKRQPPNNNADKLGLTQISLITPYINKWRICGIVSNKENIREINRPSKQTLTVFSFVVTDQQGNSIKVSAFGETADKFHPIVTNGQVFYISGNGTGSVRGANKQFNSTGHDYELTLSRDSEVTLCTDTLIDEPKFKLNIVPLNRITENAGHLIDILAIVDRAGEITQVTTKKDSKQLDKRDIYLVDESGVEISMTLWGEKATDFDMAHVGEVIGVKGCAVREFNGGFTLSPSAGAIIKYNPEGDATNKLYLWHREQRPTADIKTLSTTAGDSNASFERDLRLIGMAVQHHIGQDSDRGAYFNVKAMITAIKTENAFYQACPTENCKKKLIVENNQYRCEKCNSTFDNFKNVIMLSVEIADFSGTAWATVFDDRASVLLGVNGDQLAQLQRDDPVQYEAVFEKIRFREFNFRVRVKYDMYNDQQQMRWTLFDMKPVPYDRCKRLFAEAIQKCENVY